MVLKQIVLPISLEPSIVDAGLLSANTDDETRRKLMKVTSIVKVNNNDMK